MTIGVLQKNLPRATSDEYPNLEIDLEAGFTCVTCYVGMLMAV